MKSKWELFSSIFELIVGLSSITSLVILGFSGENMVKWIPTFILSIAFVVMGVTGIIDYKTNIELSDDEMITELLIELGEDDFDSLNESEKVIYTSAAFEMEVLNGGVVQFLSNEAYGSASYVCEALEKLGAEDHLNLLQQDLEKNKVNLNDLSAFVTDDLDAFSKLYNQYNFDSYENEYYNMSSIPDHIRTYIRDHAEDFSQ